MIIIYGNSRILGKINKKARQMPGCLISRIESGLKPHFILGSHYTRLKSRG